MYSSFFSFRSSLFAAAFFVEQRQPSGSVLKPPLHHGLAVANGLLALDQQVHHLLVKGKHQQIGVCAGPDAALFPGLSQQSGRVFGEEPEGGLQRKTLPAEHAAHFLQQGGTGGGGKADAVAGLVEQRLASAAVAAHGDPAGVGALTEGAAQRGGGAGLVFRKVGGKVDEAAHAVETHGVGDELGRAAAMRGEEAARRHLRVFHCPKQLLHPLLVAAHMDGDKARLAGNHAADAGLGPQTGQLLPGDRRAPMVGEGGLDADDLVHQRDIPLHVAGEGDGGDAVIAGEHPGGQPLLLQSPHLEQQVFQTAGYAVGAQQTHDGGDAVERKIGELKLGDAGGGALLSAASGGVDVDVDQTRAHRCALHVPHANRGSVGPQAEIPFHGGDHAAFDQNVPDPQVGGRVHITVFPKCQHVTLLK